MKVVQLITELISLLVTYKINSAVRLILDDMRYFVISPDQESY